MLRRQPGDTVLDVGCGTGLNFALLSDAVGHSGRVIGLDRSPQMLDVARRRMDHRGWSNVAIVHADATDFGLEDLEGRAANAVLSTYAMSVIVDAAAAWARMRAVLPRVRVLPMGAVVRRPDGGAARLPRRAARTGEPMLRAGRDGVAAQTHRAAPRARRRAWVAPRCARGRVALSLRVRAVRAPACARHRRRVRTRSGATHVDVEPDRFLARLVGLVPPSRQHQVRYFGVFSNLHALRPQLRVAPGSPIAALPTQVPLFDRAHLHPWQSAV